MKHQVRVFDFDENFTLELGSCSLLQTKTHGRTQDMSQNLLLMSLLCAMCTLLRASNWVLRNGTSIVVHSCRGVQSNDGQKVAVRP